MQKEILNKNFVKLAFKSKQEIDKGITLNGIYLPFGVGKDALVKTVIAEVENVSNYIKENYNLAIGDKILVDRYAIITDIQGLESETFIDIGSIIMKYMDTEDIS